MRKEKARAFKRVNVLESSRKFPSRSQRYTLHWCIHRICFLCSVFLTRKRHQPHDGDPPQRYTYPLRSRVPTSPILLLLSCLELKPPRCLRHIPPERSPQPSESRLPTTHRPGILLKAGGNINRRNRYGPVAAHDAAMVRDYTPASKKKTYDALRYFVEHGGDMDIACGDDTTARKSPKRYHAQAIRSYKHC